MEQENSKKSADKNSDQLDSDPCDCCHAGCPGCFYPCESCGSVKCGAVCRLNRSWKFYLMEEENGMDPTDKQTTEHEHVPEINDSEANKDFSQQKPEKDKQTDQSINVVEDMIKERALDINKLQI